MKKSLSVLLLTCICFAFSGCGMLRSISERDVEGVFRTDGLIDHFYQDLIIKKGNEFEEWDLFYGYYPGLNDYDVNVRGTKRGKWELDEKQLVLTTLFEDDIPIDPSSSAKRVFGIKKMFSGVLLVEEGTTVPNILKRCDEQ